MSAAIPEWLFDRAGFRYLLRPARLADAECLAQLDAVVFTSEAWSTDIFARSIGSAHERYLLLELPGDEERVAGFVGVSLTPPEADLLAIVIASDLRERGLGRGMLAAAEGLAGQHRCRQLFLEVRASNTAALNLYRGAGYETLGQRERYYHNPPEAAVVMRKLLRVE
ncbi:MAG: ribosomal protein S18-alanine N-acetyltransferase [Varibaculum sp.]|nr:ribosomal protein S18-alanine N-acetyltransferase [Varibaculum sp.]